MIARPGRREALGPIGKRKKVLILDELKEVSRGRLDPDGRCCSIWARPPRHRERLGLLTRIIDSVQGRRRRGQAWPFDPFGAVADTELARAVAQEDNQDDKGVMGPGPKEWPAPERFAARAPLPMSLCACEESSGTPPPPGLGSSRRLAPGAAAIALIALS